VSIDLVAAVATEEGVGEGRERVVVACLLACCVVSVFVVVH
jgi:hypothetical protein